MESALVRRCFRLLADDDILQMLRSDPALAEEIRRSSNKPKGFRVNAAHVRKWLAMPRQSDKLLARFPHVVRERVGGSEPVDLVWPPAMVAFAEIGDHPNPTDELFGEILDRVRIAGDAAAVDDEGDPEDALHPVAAGLKAISDSLLSEVLGVVQALTNGGKARVPETSVVDRWNDSVELAWKEIGKDTPDDAGFTLLSEVASARDEEESAMRLAERRRELEGKRTSYLKLIESLQGTGSTSGTFSDALDEANAELATLDDQLLHLGAATAGEAKTRPDEMVERSSASQPKSEPEVEADPGSEPEPTVEPEPVIIGVDMPKASVDASVAASTESVAESVLKEAHPAASHKEADRLDPVEATKVADDAVILEPARLDNHAAEPEKGIDSDQSDNRNAALDATEEAAPTEDASDDWSVVPDVVVDLVADGRFGAAWLVVCAAGASASVSKAFKLASDAFSSGYGGVDPSTVLVDATRLSADRGIDSRDIQLVALSASLRAGLAAGWLMRAEIDGWVRSAVEVPAYESLIAAAVEASDHGYQHLRDFHGHDGHTPRDIVGQAETLKIKLDGIHHSFSRADHVLHFLLRRDEPLGKALDLMAGLDGVGTTRQDLADALEALNDPIKVIKMADAQVSSAQQLRKEIVSHARASLERSVQEVKDLLVEAISTANFANVGGADANTARLSLSLVAAAQGVLEHDATTIGELTMKRLAGWLTKPGRIEPSVGSVEVIRSELLPVTSVPRDSEGLPLVEEAQFDNVVYELREPRDAATLFELYAEKGDLDSAAEIAALESRLQNRLVDARRDWESRLPAMVNVVRADIGKTSAGYNSASTLSTMEARLIGPDSYVGDRYDLQMRLLDDVAAEIEAERARMAEAMRKQMREDVSDSSVSSTIEGLIAKSDFIGANEVLALARAGQSLPAVDNSQTGVGAAVLQEFKDFLGTLKPGESLDATFEAAGILPDGSNLPDPVDFDRLAGWRREHGRFEKKMIGGILQALGLELVRDIALVKTPGRTYELFRAAGKPIDGSLVPALGSQASHYNIAVTDDLLQLHTTVAAASQNSTGPVIVLVNKVVQLDQRRRLLQACRDGRFNAIVIDCAVAVFVTKNYPKAFRTVQQVTLPFANFPYYSSVAGKVADEVFVGRQKELQNLADRRGSQFVYGGRQLGKSALLRKLKDDFETGEGQVAIYIDLNTHGIGQWADPSELWGVIYNRLAEYPEFGISRNRNVRKSEPVIRAIQTWLDGAPERRILLLLDEADQFLEKESSKVAAFRNIGPLKGLKEDSDGRFKPIFAGLHKVQRLQNVANTPLAHGGDDVLVGPLNAGPARDLVVRPLESLGYQFENPDNVWRLLAFTNMQPSLIQIVCMDLLEHLRAKRLRAGEPVISITEADIDAVTRSRATRTKIAEKLRLTIRLEERFRVIALTAAIMSMEDEFRFEYQPQEIREQCESHWREGFVDLNSSEFVVYLDELVGLGVLARGDNGDYFMRSPNIVTMLGTMEQLQAELVESADQFELPSEFNPRSVRRTPIVGGKPLHSPLSEHDLAQIIPLRRKYETPRDFIVLGSSELGVSDVSVVLGMVAQEREVDATIVGASDSVGDEIGSFSFTGAGASWPKVLIIDATQVDSSGAVDLIGHLKKMRNRSAGHFVVIFPAHAAGVVIDLTEHRTSVEKVFITLEKWSGDGLRAWQENPFSTPTDRTRLLDETGGWPRLVESGVSSAAAGKSLEETLQALSRFPGSREEAEGFLSGCGVPAADLALLTQWAELAPSDFEPVDQVADILEAERGLLQEMAGVLTLVSAIDERQGAYRIDSVVVRALLALKAD